MKTTRTDIHRPSAIVPADYIEVAYLPHSIDFSNAPFVLAQQERVRKHMDQTGGNYSSHAHGGNCDICGNAQAMTHVIFHHVPSNTYVRVGEQCAYKVGANFDRSAFTHFVKCAAEARERAAGKAKAQVLLADYGLSEAWDVYNRLELTRGSWNGTTNAERIVVDIVNGFVRYGSISEKQQDFLRKLLGDISGEKERLSERAQENEERKARSQHVGSVGERRDFEATIRFTKDFDSQFGVTTLTVLDDADGNSLVWFGRGFGEPKGTKLTFKATIKGHDERDGVKQTKITRAKLLSVAEPAEAAQ